MKRLILALTVALTLALTLTAGAETAVVTPLEGLITELGEDYFLMEDIANGQVQVNLSDETAYEGTVARDTLAVGQYVYVDYDGKMTRSLPPQVSADRVRCFAAQGTVTEILEDGYLLDGDETLGAVIVHMDESLPAVYQGMNVTVYYNGVMAMSYPGQVYAVHVVIPTLEGTVSELNDGNFTLTTAEGIAYAIVTDEQTQRLTLPAEGETLRVAYNGVLVENEPVTAMELSSPEAEETTAEGEAAEKNEATPELSVVKE